MYFRVYQNVFLAGDPLKSISIREEKVRGRERQKPYFLVLCLYLFSQSGFHQSEFLGMLLPHKSSSTVTQINPVRYPLI